MKRRLITLILPLTALLLEMTPWGAKLNFALDGGGTSSECFSYFSLIPFGYANFAPFITAILTCFLCILTLLYVISGKPNLHNAAVSVTGLTAFASVMPITLGIDYITPVAVLIILSFIGQIFVLLKLFGDGDKPDRSKDNDDAAA